VRGVRGNIAFSSQGNYLRDCTPRSDSSWEIWVADKRGFYGCTQVGRGEKKIQKKERKSKRKAEN